MMMKPNAMPASSLMPAASKAPPVAKDPVLSKIRETILKRIGDNGIRAVSRAFRCMDDDSNQILTPDEFRTGLRDCGVHLLNEDFESAMQLFDKNGDGVINVTEFLVALKGTMNARRMKVVEVAFERFDSTKDGKVDLYDLRDVYDVSRHPEVLGGKITEADALLQFLCLFDDQSNPDGVVTKQEFIAYYTGLSASIDSDEFFESMVIRAWNLDKPPQQRKRKEAIKIPETVEEMKSTFQKSSHPLYNTTNGGYGASCEGQSINKERFRTGAFTKNSFGPPRSTGLNTSVSKGRVL